MSNQTPDTNTRPILDPLNENPVQAEKHITTVGGQALIEGLMMIGPKNTAIAVRKPNGEIVIEMKPPLKKGRLSKIPLIRGSVLLIRQMILGMKALMFSAECIEIEDDPKDLVLNDPQTSSKKTFSQKIDVWLTKIFGDKLKDVVIVFSIILSIGISIGLFMLLPNVIATLLFMPFEQNAALEFPAELLNRGPQNFGIPILRNLLEGLIRIFIFFSYILLAGKISPEMNRVWQYHGAEHKTIHAYENGEELTVENIRKYTTLHPRCGTSFVFTVMMVSILVFSLAGWHGIFWNLILRLLLLPVVAGISYEIFRYIGKKNNRFVQILKAPGLWFQKLTTAEPDDSMLEVAILAMAHALSSNKEDDKW
jgi:uncharacterized protein YqhQ